MVIGLVVGAVAAVGAAAGFLLRGSITTAAALLVALLGPSALGSALGGAQRWAVGAGPGSLIAQAVGSDRPELGWAAGAGKRTLVLCERVDEPELMYLMCSHIAVSIDEAAEWLAGYQRVMAAPVVMDLFEIDEGGESHICAARDHAEALELTGIGIDADDEVTVKRLSKTCELASIEIVDEDGGKSTYAQEILGAEKDGRGRLISSTAW